MECSPAAVAYLSAVWITLAAWAVHNLLAASPAAAPANVAFDVLVVLAAAASRLLLVMCRPSLPVDDTGGAAAGGCRPRLAAADRGASSARATDPAAVRDFLPREHGGDDGAVQCVVCLGEVGDGERVKRMPACRHLFHQQCIDAWLHGHSTCPVCRRSVSRPDGAG